MSLFGNYSRKKNLPIDYHKKKLENPFYKRRGKIISFANIKGKLIVFSVALILLFIFWFIFISHFWVITKISISGIDQISNDKVSRLLAEQMRAGNFILFPQGNLLFFNETKFREILQKEYHFQSINLKKEWPNGLVINIINKPISCIWNEGDKYYYADTDGYAVQEISPLDLKENKYPLISNSSLLKIYNGRIGIDPSYLDFAALLFEKFPKVMPEITIDRFNVNDDVDTIKLVTTGGLTVLFNTKDNTDKQLNNLLILKNQKLKDDFKKQKTIDLRFGDKIYYQ
jgi:cell division septal protein FtsQ